MKKDEKNREFIKDESKGKALSEANEVKNELNEEDLEKVAGGVSIERAAFKKAFIRK